MRYYMILLRNGKVVEICSYDNEKSRDEYVKNMLSNMQAWSKYDDVQTLDEAT